MDSLTLPQIVELVEADGDLSAKCRGKTVEVFNSSGKRKLGEVFQRRDGSWGSRLPSGSPAASRLSDRLAAASSNIGESAGMGFVEAVKRGDARALGFTDEEILDAVRAGVIAESDAMNQDF